MNGERLQIETKPWTRIGISPEALERKRQLESFGVPFNGILLNEQDCLNMLAPDELGLDPQQKCSKFIINTKLSLESSQWDSLILSTEMQVNTQFTIDNVSDYIYTKLVR